MGVYNIRYTRLAKAALAANLAAFEEQFRAELAEFMEDCEPDDLLFHSMEFGSRLFVGSWHGPGWILVDSAHEEERLIESGPRKGRAIIVPRPDSE